MEPIKRVKEKIDGTMQDAEFAWNLRKYVNGEKTASELLTVEDSRTYLGGGEDVIPLRKRAWGNIVQSMIEIQGPAVVAGVKEGFKDTGKRDAAKAKHLFDDEDLGKLFEFWTEFGYVDIATITAVFGDGARDILLEEIGTIVHGSIDALHVTTENSFSVRAVREAGFESAYPICIYGPPYAAGFFEEWTGTTCTCSEDTCQGTGDDHCTWIFEFPDTA